MVLLSEAWLAPPPLGPCVIAGAWPDALAEILRPAAQLALWPRPLPPPLRREAAALAARPFEALAEAAPDEAARQLGGALPGAAPALLHDIHALALVFAGIAGVGQVRLRLESHAAPPCPRFHADAVGLRLLCTYHGPGTQWLALPGGARAARALPEPPPPPEQAAPGTVLLMKGEGHPGQAGRGLIHRSPPAAAGGRLLLCLDEPGRIPLP